MDVPNPTVQVPVTPGYLLNQYRAFAYRIPDPETGKDMELTLDSTVEDWFVLYDVHVNKTLHKRLNRSFGILLKREEWEEVLQPAKEKRFRGVCELISRRAMRPAIGTLQLGPFSSRTAGAFIAIREFLREKGADADQITPSTLLAPYILAYRDELPSYLLKLAPRSLPTIHYRCSHRDRILERISVTCFLGIFPFAIIMACIGLNPLIRLLSFLLLCIVFCLCLNQRSGIPESVEYQGLKTFRDLAFALTKESEGFHDEIPTGPRSNWAYQPSEDPQWIAKLPRFPNPENEA
jgi:hypothetical protein